MITPRPAAHYEIPRIRVYRLLLLDPAAHVLDEFEVYSPGKTAGDFVLRFRKIGAIGVEPVRPKMRPAFSVDQLRVHSNLVAGPPDATF